MSLQLTLLLFGWSFLNGNALICIRKLLPLQANNAGEVKVMLAAWPDKSTHFDTSIGPHNISALWVNKKSFVTTGFSKGSERYKNVI